jgi:hypothetical protein
MEERLRRALSRNINEVRRAEYNRLALIELENKDAVNSTSMTFFGLAYMALKDDMVMHLIRVFERGNVASYWYIARCEDAEIAKFAAANELDLSKLDLIADKLKPIRDKTHVHIDRDAVFDPKEVWREAAISGTLLADALDISTDILLHLWQLRVGSPYPLAHYEADDVEGIAEAARERKLLPPERT